MMPTHIIFEVLTSGGAWSHEELQAKTGLPLEAIRNAMHVLRRRGHQAMEPNRYVATEAAMAYVAEIRRRAEKAAATRAETAKRKAALATVTAEERLARQQAQRKRDIEAKRQRRLEKRAAIAKEDARNFVHRRVAAPVEADSIVSTAVQSRPALQAAWGAPTCA